MVWIATVALIRPSDGKVVKVNADEAIFYTQRGWKSADDVGKTSGGEPRPVTDEDATADANINGVHEANVVESEVKQPKVKSADNNLSDIII